MQSTCPWTAHLYLRECLHTLLYIRCRIEPLSYPLHCPGSLETTFIHFEIGRYARPLLSLGIALSSTLYTIYARSNINGDLIKWTGLEGVMAISWCHIILPPSQIRDLIVVHIGWRMQWASQEIILTSLLNQLRQGLRLEWVDSTKSSRPFCHCLHGSWNFLLSDVRIMQRWFA